MDLEFRELKLNDAAAFRQAVKECDDEPEFAFNFDPQEPFETYLAHLADWKRGENLPERFVPNSYFVAVVDGAIAGRVSLRHELNHFLRTIGGHIGYVVVPRFRRMGVATAMFQQALLQCPRFGIAQVVVTCDEGNEASRKVIERGGGILEAIVTEDVEVPKRRYLVPVAGRKP